MFYHQKCHFLFSSCDLVSTFFRSLLTALDCSLPVTFISLPRFFWLFCSVYPKWLVNVPNFLIVFLHLQVPLGYGRSWLTTQPTTHPYSLVSFWPVCPCLVVSLIATYTTYDCFLIFLSRRFVNIARVIARVRLVTHLRFSPSPSDYYQHYYY